MKRRAALWLAVGAVFVTNAARAQDFLASGSHSAWLGYAVAVDGDRAAVGAPGQLHFPPGGTVGRVYVYERQGGVWVETAILGGDEPETNFGWSVALDGDDIVVGKPGASDGTDPGEAHTFHFDGTEWVPGPILSSGTQDWDRFGESVALDGGQLLVGAPRDDLGDVDAGAVYSYVGGGPTWTLEEVLLAEAPLAYDFFGFRVAVRGGEALVGNIADDEGHSNAGSVSAYEYVDDGWLLVDVLFPEDPALNGSYGRALDLRGGLALVGSVADMAEVWSRVPGAWQRERTLLPPAGLDGSAFGYSVALDDAGRAMVGAPSFSHPVGHEGAVFTFYGQDWTSRSLRTELPGHTKFFGGSLASDGARVVVGAHLYSQAVTQDGAGWAYEEGELAPPLFESFCPCGPGPCGNGAFESGCMNSSGAGASLLVSGSSSVTQDDLVLHVYGTPVDTLGMVIMGDGITDVTVGDGRLCVSAGTIGFFRFPVLPTGIGGFDLGPGLIQYSHLEFGAGGILAGQTWNFQAWFRDGTGPCGGGINLTNAMKVTFTP